MTQIASTIGTLLGFAAAGGALMLIAELRYRWSIHRSLKKSFPKQQHESFTRYLFMAWFVRNDLWYEKQRRKP